MKNETEPISALLVENGKYARGRIVFADNNLLFESADGTTYETHIDLQSLEYSVTKENLSKFFLFKKVRPCFHLKDRVGKKFSFIADKLEFDKYFVVTEKLDQLKLQAIAKSEGREMLLSDASLPVRVETDDYSREKKSDIVKKNEIIYHREKCFNYDKPQESLSEKIESVEVEPVNYGSETKLSYVKYETKDCREKYSNDDKLQESLSDKTKFIEVETADDSKETKLSIVKNEIIDYCDNNSYFAA